MKINQHDRNIHISAVSDIYAVYEVVPESKAVKRLEQIRDGFLQIKQHHLSSIKNNKSEDSASKYETLNNLKLVVKIGIHNPFLFPL